ncbi:alpha/beta hydrolase family protein [Luteococcus sp.]|uniref:alpha/beta hydrolase family protein n=1 Tax=Luteococcus sp. TaxID=1969402 RepID=UPI003737045F
MNLPNDLAWVDDIDHSQLLAELACHGTEIPSEPSDDAPPARAGGYQLLPIEDSWLRLEQDESGRLWASHVPDARFPDVSDGSPQVRFDDDNPDLDGWMTTRADIDGSGRRWVSVLRRPEREAYVALLYDAGETGPTRSLMMRGIYPDVSLLDGGSRLVFVEPDREVRGGQRAIVALADPERYESSRREIAHSATGGISVKPCSVRRYFKMSHGIRSERVWDLVDARAKTPTPISVPGSPSDPSLFDVALLDGKPTLVQLFNGDDSWALQASLLHRERVMSTWVCATGVGRARELVSGTGHAIVRVAQDGEETLYRINIEGFSSGREPALRSPGVLDLRQNQVTPSIGFAATELASGVMPYVWYFDRAGECRNDPEEVALRAAGLANSARESYTSFDGYTVDLDLRWPAGDAPFCGAVVLMLYGAYGLDLDLDLDPDLGTWLGRGFAVATPHVRGGGPEQRHLAGTRAKRDRSVADAVAAVHHLRSGKGAVTATQVVTLGASAGGFLSAATLNGCRDEVDICVVVNGFVDPITSLLRGDTQTRASDEDEWGDPRNNPNDLETLRRIAPIENLVGSYSAEALVVVSGCDVRVNPRQGLKWVMRYRELGGSAELWFDPKGAHDCWGAGLPRTALVDWVSQALARRAEA